MISIGWSPYKPGGFAEGVHRVVCDVQANQWKIPEKLEAIRHISPKSLCRIVLNDERLHRNIHIFHFCLKTQFSIPAPLQEKYKLFEEGKCSIIDYFCQVVDLMLDDGILIGSGLIVEQGVIDGIVKSMPPSYASTSYTLGLLQSNRLSVEEMEAWMGSEEVFKRGFSAREMDQWIQPILSLAFYFPKRIGRFLGDMSAKLDKESFEKYLMKTVVPGLDGQSRDLRLTMLWACRRYVDSSEEKREIDLQSVMNALRYYLAKEAYASLDSEIALWFRSISS